jgi:hypothetical protein
MGIIVYDPDYEGGCLCDDCMTLECFANENELLTEMPGKLTWNGNFGTLVHKGVTYDIYDGGR